MFRYLLPAGIFLVLVGFFFVGLQRDPTVVPSPLIGKPAPQFELESLEQPGTKVSSEQFAGQMYVLNVWGTWCGGCREEHPALLAIERQGLVPLVGLNWKDDTDLARRWLRDLGDPYVATAVDQEGRVAIDWGVYGAPETFLVDANGIVLHKHLAPITLEIWERDFVPLIKAASAKQGDAS
ncbi:MAG TPA: DsbE family thiol:disulfide interchange protein [Steroidobacteraceae bacterium]|nr:DsbE family thiol:disulfide interchange protein [Steroidobacteraceae bacterium]